VTGYEGPLADLPALLVRSCDACGGTMLLDPSMESWLKYADATFGVYTLCGKCQRAEDKRQAAVDVQLHTRCAHKRYPGGLFSDLAVTGLFSDRATRTLMVEVCVIGLGPLPLAEQNVILGRAGVPAWFQERRTWPRSELLMKGL
jgi:hypothetical protein